MTVIFSSPCSSTGAAQICELRIDIFARRRTWSEESVQVSGEVRTSITFATLRAFVVSICVNELDEAVTLEAGALYSTLTGKRIPLNAIADLISLLTVKALRVRATGTRSTRMLAQ